MRYSLIISAFLLSLYFFGSCAKTEDLNEYEVSKTSWDLYMADYVAANPQVKAVGDDGLYMETLQESELLINPKPSEGGWVSVNYTYKDMNGNVFGTRYQDEAELQGTYSKYCHYAPHYVYLHYTKAYAEIPTGVYDALLTMRETEITRAYVPYWIGFGSYETYFNYGYDGQYTLGSYQNFTMDIELVEVIDDIEEHHYKNVVSKATSRWGLTSQDTVANGLFVKYDLYPYEGAETRDSITSDSVVNIYYKGAFLDDYVFETNIDSVAFTNFGDYTFDDASYYTISSETMIEAFNLVLPTMVYDQWVGMVFTSTYGYGEDGCYPDSETAGSSTTQSVIQPFEPLYFEFYVKPYEED